MILTFLNHLLGLLAGLWQFPEIFTDIKDIQPSFSISSIQSKTTDFLDRLDLSKKFSLKESKYLGQLTHLFSHIKQCIEIHHVQPEPIKAEMFASLNLP
jgi:adenine-specific DNA glycosylase